MSTFLELCQDVAREGGISGGIVSVSGQSGEAGRVVGWVARAYKYIQNLHEDWKFMRRGHEFGALPDTASYTPTAAGVTEFGRWCFSDQWRTFLTAAGYPDEQPLVYVDYDTFRRTYGYGNSRLQVGRPQAFTVAPDKSLMLWPTPDQPYTIVGEYYRAPHVMESGDDVPIFPAQHHEAIMYRALMFYGQFEGDATVIATGMTEFDRELATLEGAELPRMGTCGAGPLA